MARPLRVEFPGALYYISSVGNGGNPIFKDSSDGNIWLNVFDNVCNRFNWECLSYCLMSDRYHLIVRTPEANLSKGMRQLNGNYTQNYNRKHNVGGHVFQGRYKSVLVQESEYLLPLIKYITLLPQRAGFVNHPSQFKWCSSKYLYAKEDIPNWMELSWFEEEFSSDISSFDEFLDIPEESEILNKVTKQIYLGDDNFILSIQKKLTNEKLSEEIPNTQLTKPISFVFESYMKSSKDKNEALAKTYLTGDYTLKEIGDYMGMHYSSVSKIVKEYEYLFN